MSPLEEAQDRLQRAVNTGSYAEAQHRLAEYTRAVNAALAKAGPGDRRAIDTVSSALDLLHWADRAVRAGRAHDSAGLARLAATRPYRGAPRQTAARFQLEA